MSDAQDIPDEQVEDLQDVESEVDAADADISGLPGFLANKIPPQMRQTIAVMQQDNGIAKMLLRPVYQHDADGNPTVSQADVIADMLNIQALDAKALGEAADVDIEATRITPERAALMLQALVEGEDLSLIEKFNENEEKREQVLGALTDEETVEEHRQVKKSVSYTEQKSPDMEDEDDD